MRGFRKGKKRGKADLQFKQGEAPAEEKENPPRGEKKRKARGIISREKPAKGQKTIKSRGEKSTGG